MIWNGPEHHRVSAGVAALMGSGGETRPQNSLADVVIMMPAAAPPVSNDSQRPAAITYNQYLLADVIASIEDLKKASQRIAQEIPVTRVGITDLGEVPSPAATGPSLAGELHRMRLDEQANQPAKLNSYLQDVIYSIHSSMVEIKNADTSLWTELRKGVFQLAEGAFRGLPPETPPAEQAERVLDEHAATREVDAVLARLPRAEMSQEQDNSDEVLRPVFDFVNALSENGLYGSLFRRIIDINPDGSLNPADMQRLGLNANFQALLVSDLAGNFPQAWRDAGKSQQLQLEQLNQLRGIYWSRQEAEEHRINQLILLLNDHIKTVIENLVSAMRQQWDASAAEAAAMSIDKTRKPLVEFAGHLEESREQLHYFRAQSRSCISRLARAATVDGNSLLQAWPAERIERAHTDMDALSGIVEAAFDAPTLPDVRLPSGRSIPEFLQELEEFTRAYISGAHEFRHNGASEFRLPLAEAYRRMEDLLATFGSPAYHQDDPFAVLYPKF